MTKQLLLAVLVICTASRMVNSMPDYNIRDEPAIVDSSSECQQAQRQYKVNMYDSHKPNSKIVLKDSTKDLIDGCSNDQGVSALYLARILKELSSTKFQSYIRFQLNNDEQTLSMLDTVKSILSGEY